MKQEHLDILRECLLDNDGGLAFPCYDHKSDNDYYMGTCKEIAVRRPAIPLRAGVIIQVPNNKSMGTIEKFKSLSALFGIPVQLETFVHRDSYFVCIKGWYSRNLIRSDIARLLFKTAYNATRNFKSLDEFYTQGYYSMYFPKDWESGRQKIAFFNDLKNNIERQKSYSKLLFEGCGIFSWITRGLVK